MDNIFRVGDLVTTSDDERYYELTEVLNQDVVRGIDRETGEEETLPTNCMYKMRKLGDAP